MKTCTKCGKTKDFSEFTKDKSRKDGYRICCKECTKERYYKLKTDVLLQLKKEIVSSVRMENKILQLDSKRLCSRCKRIYIIGHKTGHLCRECNSFYRAAYVSTESGKERERERAKENYKKNRKNIG